MPRGTLNPDVIVTAAIDLLDAEGLDGLTIRRLAGRLRVQPTALYTHFRDKGALMQAVVTALYDRFEMPENVESDILLLRRIMRGYFQLLVDNPVVLKLDSLEDADTLDARIAEAIYGCVQRLGLDDGTTVGMASTLQRFVIGSAAVHPSRRAWDEDPQFWERIRQRMAALPRDTYPYTHKLSRDFPGLTQQEAFEFGLDVQLGAVATAAGKPPEQTMWEALTKATEGSSVADLTDLTGMSGLWVGNRLRDLAEDGRVTQVSPGRWRVRSERHEAGGEAAPERTPI
jgi:AcrR family transcriptional regulator